MVVIYVLVLKDVIFRKHIYHTLSGDQVLRKQCGGGGNKFGRFWYLRRNGIITWSYHSQYHSHIFQYYVVTVPPINVWVLSTYSLWVPRECPVCSTAARRDVRGGGKGFRGSTFSGTPVKREGPKKRREGKDVYVMQGLSVSREPSWIGGVGERERPTKDQTGIPFVSVDPRDNGKGKKGEPHCKTRQSTTARPFQTEFPEVERKRGIHHTNTRPPHQGPKERKSNETHRPPRAIPKLVHTTHSTAIPHYHTTKTATLPHYHTTLY